MVKITLPDNTDLEFDSNPTALDVAERIGPGLAKASLAARIDNRLYDMAAVIEQDSAIEIITTKSDRETAVELIRHSCAHVMAEAVCGLFPEAQLVYGPTVKNGFYYDIDLDYTITPEDFEAIEAEMKKIIAEDKPFVRYELGIAEAMSKLEREANHYKIENAKLAKGNKLSFYKTGQDNGCFEDLCLGPHIQRTGQIGAFKLMSVAGAYFHGDASQKMLQRIYGTAFSDKKELKQYLNRLEEAKKRDHRVLGRQLDLFSFHEEAPGFPFLHANGMIIWNELLKFWHELHDADGYQEVRTPVILNEKLWHQSGHWDNYKENMYFTSIDEVNYAVKPMNCPGGCLVYKSRPHSYREFPIKMAELGMVHRHEASGVLHGLLRVRQFTQDDAHIFCLPNQVAREVIDVMNLTFKTYNTFGLTDCKIELSTKPEKHIGSDEMWETATNALKDALEKKGIDYAINPGDGAFYGPKIDFHVSDCLGRTWQLGTIQLDFSMPQRLDLVYADRNNSEQRPVMIHRVVLGAMERFLGILIEHYGGAFPLWLSPEQARVMPISEKTNKYAEKVFNCLKKAGLRCTIDTADDKINAKIKKAHSLKLPYMLIVGPNEAENGTVNVRIRVKKEQIQLKLDEFIEKTLDEIAHRKLELSLQADNVNLQEIHK